MNEHRTVTVAPQAQSLRRNGGLIMISSPVDLGWRRTSTLWLCGTAWLLMVVTITYKSVENDGHYGLSCHPPSCLTGLCFVPLTSCFFYALLFRRGGGNFDYLRQRYGG